MHYDVLGKAYETEDMTTVVKPAKMEDLQNEPVLYSDEIDEENNKKDIQIIDKY